MLEKNETKLWDSAPRALIELSAIHYHASFDTENANSPMSESYEVRGSKIRILQRKNYAMKEFHRVFLQLAYLFRQRQNLHTELEINEEKIRFSDLSLTN